MLMGITFIFISSSCDTRPERDLWRGFIIGLATGRIPEDVPLTPSQLHAIASAMERLQTNPSSRPSPGSVANGSCDFNDHHPNGNQMMLSNGVHSVSAASSASSSGGSGGRPSIRDQVKENVCYNFKLLSIFNIFLSMIETSLL